MAKYRSSLPEVFCKKGALGKFTIFTGKHLCQSFFFNKETCNFIKKVTLAQAFACEFCEISMNTFFHRTALVAASANISKMTCRLTCQNDMSKIAHLLEKQQYIVAPKVTGTTLANPKIN